MRLLGEGLSWSASTDIGAKLALLLTTVIWVRSLAPITFGQYTGLLATSMLAAALWDAGSSTLLTREFAKGSLSTRSALSQIVRLRQRLLGVWVVGFLLGSYFVLRGHWLGIEIVGLFAIGSAISGMWAAPVAILRAALQFRQAGLAVLFGRSVTAVLSGLALLQGNGATRLQLLAVAVAVGEAAILGVSGYFTSLLSLPAIISTPSRLSVRAALPFAVNSTLSIIYNRFDVVILAALSSAYQLSVYAPASRLQDALYSIPTALGLVGLSVASSLWSRAADRQQAAIAVGELVRRLTFIGLLVALPIAVLVWIYTPQIIQTVLGPAYGAASTPARILVWFLPLAVIQAPILAALAATGHAGDTTKVFAATFVTAMVMHLSLDWWLGGIGASIASLSRDPVAVVLVGVIAWKRGILPFGKSRIGHFPTAAVASPTRVAQ